MQPYAFPPTFQLPPNILLLDPKNTVLVRKAAACLRAAFLGTTLVPGAPFLTETYFGKEFTDQPLDASVAADAGLRRFNSWLMNFTLYRHLPFGGVLVYVEDVDDGTSEVVVTSVAVCIPPNTNNWDVYSNCQPSVCTLVVCPWNWSRVGLPPFAACCDCDCCCYASAKRLRKMDEADVEMRHRTMADNKYWYLHAIGTTPSMQRRGRASALVDALSRLADAENVAMYIESGSPSNYLFYKKRGFTKMETIHPYDFSTSCALLRPPSSEREGGGAGGEGCGNSK